MKKTKIDKDNSGKEKRKKKKPYRETLQKSTVF